MDSNHRMLRSSFTSVKAQKTKDRANVYKLAPRGDQDELSADMLRINSLTSDSEYDEPIVVESEED